MTVQLTVQLTVPELVRAALGEPPILTHADLAGMLRHRYGGREVCPSRRQVYRWLHGQSTPRPAALQALHKIAALPADARIGRVRRGRTHTRR